MSIKINYPVRAVPLKEFPKLMIHKELRCVILFSEPRVGTVIDPHGLARSLGHHSASWDYASFEDFNDPITLCNGDQ